MSSNASSGATPGPEQLVDALNGVFGRHPGTRAGNAKGFCVTGRFTPSPEAASLSKAPQFAKPVGLTGRLSMGGGNPKIPDTTKPTPRGLSLRFDLGGGASTDLVMISAPIFFAKSPPQFVEFLKVRSKAPGADAPDPAKLEAFSKANPETTRQAAFLNARPVPASYAGVNYWGVHAFTLTNAEGKSRIVKLKAVPVAGEIGLSDEELKSKGPDFYLDELKERLGKGPVAFELVAILGEDGDPTDDPTAMWDEDAHATVALGRIAIDGVAGTPVCDAFTFDPANLPDGMAGPTNDPIFSVRSGAYAVGLARRLAP